MLGLHRVVTSIGFFLLSSAAIAAPVGSATGVVPEAVVHVASEQRILVVGDDLQLGDLIQTGSGGHVEVMFLDGTKLVVGPASALMIEDYLLRNDGSAGKFAINALAGTFRFMSGNSPKDRYRIDTPSGTIGIRGTEFDFVVNGRAGTQVLMYKGATELCAHNGDCAVISQTCELGDMTRDTVASVGLTDTFVRSDRQALKARFVYGASQQPLLRAFRLKETAQCLQPAFGVGARVAKEAKSDGASAAARDPKAALTAGMPALPPAGAPQVPVPAVPPSPTPPPASNDGGDCAGNSDHNPGNSQNCSH